MSATNSLPISSASQCKVCQAQSDYFESTKILRKYDVRYFRCTECGFVQTESPYWLQEAYASAITRLDVGTMERNLANCEITSAVLNLLFPRIDCGLDFAGGHGVFVRLMRDRGFNFLWSDLYASNDYARGFEHRAGQKVDFLTAFEVLEHLVDPLQDLGQIMSLSDNVLVSTTLLPDPLPRLSDWWYYTPSTGQHVSLYSPASLRSLAARFQRTVLSEGPYHLFTRQPKNPRLFRLATRRRVAILVNRFNRHKSLVEADFRQMSGA